MAERRFSAIAFWSGRTLIIIGCGRFGQQQVCLVTFTGSWFRQAARSSAIVYHSSWVYRVLIKANTLLRAEFVERARSRNWRIARAMIGRTTRVVGCSYGATGRRD